MKLAEKLKAGKYRPKPLPKPRRAESEAARQKRKLQWSKNDFVRLLDDFMRKQDVKFGFNFLDVPVSTYDFAEIFESYSFGQYRNDPLTYKLKPSGWFYEFLFWLVNEGFTVETIKCHWSYDPDEDNRYTFRVYWK